MTEREELVERVMRATAGFHSGSESAARAAIAECEKDRADLTSVICDRDQTVDRLERELAEEKKQHYGTAELAHEFQAQCATMRVALARLSNEVLGSLPLMEPLARREFGNTNYSLLIQRGEESRALLSSDAGRKVLDVVRAFSDLCADVRERYKIPPNERFKCPIMQRGADALSALGWKP